MKKTLLKTIDEIIDLLTVCDWPDEASWFAAKQKLLRALDPHGAEFRRELAEIKNVIAGMGSFTDVPLYPKKGVKLTAQEARNKQWELAERLGQAVKEALANSSAGSEQSTK